MKTVKSKETMKLSQNGSILLSVFFVLFSFQPAFATDIDTATGVAQKKSADQIVVDLEKRYSGSGFSADFYQESPLPDIGITESASGKAFFKKPGKFRWEYQNPDVLHYISNGSKLWIHSPEDNNVWIGEASTFFGKESSAGLLTDISQIRKKFSVTLAETLSDTTWELSLLPVGTSAFGISRIFLSIDKKTGTISKIISFNASNSETQITLSNYQFKTPPDSVFDFQMPKNASIIPLDQ